MTFYEERMAEKDLLERVLTLAQLGGWRVAHFHDSRREVGPGRFIGDAAARGWPDLVLARGARLLFRELKTEKGKVEAAQAGWIEALQEAGVDAAVWRPRDMDEIEQELIGHLKEG